MRLRDFGLILTPDRRVYAMRPAILDDGTGGRIVGWMDDDLAAMELETWDPARRGQPRKPERPEPPHPTPTAAALAPT
ncbi:MAG: hypothetical protein H0X17_12590, partial [Deltaproteobacteria bacterium]|nr:hypothetical protein [Deltaproteobacteria bacterium]